MLQQSPLICKKLNFYDAEEYDSIQSKAQKSKTPIIINQ